MSQASINNMLWEWESLDSFPNAVCSQVELTLNLGRLVTEIQKERSEVSFFVFTDNNYNGLEMHLFLSLLKIS